MRRPIVVVLALVVGLPVVFVAEEAVRTLFILRDVERERDTWQRPDAVLRELELRPGSTVVDLGSGAGYFALKMAPRVAPGGAVFAVDLRRDSLTFLWVRARLAGFGGLHVVVGSENDPHLPASRTVDAVLIANTLHEMTTPGAVLDMLRRRMRPGARLVVLDRASRGPREVLGHHELSAESAARIVVAAGFEMLHADERFIDRAGDDDVWWIASFERPAP